MGAKVVRYLFSRDLAAFRIETRLFYNCTFSDFFLWKPLSCALEFALIWGMILVWEIVEIISVGVSTRLERVGDLARLSLDCYFVPFVEHWPNRGFWFAAFPCPNCHRRAPGMRFGDPFFVFSRSLSPWTTVLLQSKNVNNNLQLIKLVYSNDMKQVWSAILRSNLEHQRMRFFHLELN